MMPIPTKVTATPAKSQAVGDTGGGWVQAQQPDEEGKAYGSDDQQQGRSILFEPQIRQIASDDFCKGRDDE